MNAWEKQIFEEEEVDKSPQGDLRLILFSFFLRGEEKNLAIVVFVSPP